MCSYTAVNNMPSCGNEFYMNGVLRESWGFDGYITRSVIFAVCVLKRLWLFEFLLIQTVIVGPWAILPFRDTFSKLIMALC